MTSDTVTPESSLTRRTMMRGAAWTVPAVAVAATAPAFAASPIVCPVVPSSTQWTKTVATGSLSSKDDGNDWITAEEKWLVFQDASDAGSASFITESPSITVRSGSRLTANFTLWWNYGNSDPNSSRPGTFEVLINGAVVKTIVTRSTGAGTRNTYNNQTFTYLVPTGTTSIKISYKYTIPMTATTASPRINANDDIVATKLNFGTCTAF